MLIDYREGLGGSHGSSRRIIGLNQDDRVIGVEAMKANLRLYGILLLVSLGQSSIGAFGHDRIVVVIQRKSKFHAK